MKNANNKTGNSSNQNCEVILKKVLNIRTQTMDTMAFVFFQN